MSIALVNSIQAAPGTNGRTTSAIDTTGATLLTVCVSYYIGASAVVSVSDNKGNTYTPLANYAGSFAANRLFYCANPAVGTGHTFTCGGTSSFPVVTAQAWSGVKTTSPLDQQNGGSASGTTSLACGSVTPSQDGSLVLTSVTDQGSSPSEAVSTPFTGKLFTNFSSGVNDGGGTAYEIQTTATARNATWSGSSSDRAGSVATFLPAVSAGGPAPHYTRRRMAGGMIPISGGLI